MNEDKQLYLVFDIETVPLPWESFTESQQEYILRRAVSEEEQAQRKAEMALAPFTSKVICIGLMMMQAEDNGEWSVINEKAFAVNEKLIDEQVENIRLFGDIDCQLSTEKKLLEDFWKILSKYKECTLISFNGRNFDAPYLMLRSALLRIKPSRDIMSGTKFNYPKHIDILDKLSFYMQSSSGPTKRFNFDFYAHAFGIKSPKSGGIDGSKVKDFYSDGRIDEIADYCMRDVKATWDLFKIWWDYLKPGY
jgi:3'-5' exonuclease